MRSDCCGRRTRVAEDRAVMLLALPEENALRVFAEVVSVTGTGLPVRSEGSLSFHYVTAHGLSRQTGLSVSAVLAAAKLLTDAHLTIENGGGWRTDFEAIRRAGDPQARLTVRRWSDSFALRGDQSHPPRGSHRRSGDADG